MMVPPSSQSSSPQQPDNNSVLPQTQTGAQQLQVTCCSFISLFAWPRCSINVLLSTLMLVCFSKNCLCSLHARLSSLWLSLFFPSTLSSCMLHIPAWLFSLGPMIQVLLSCLLHSTQSICTSFIRPRASLFCRYSTEDKTNACGCLYVGQE